MAAGGERRTVTSGSPWEERVGYRRAVRVGPHVHVAGTAPYEPDGTTHAPYDAYRQAHRCFAIAMAAAAELGAEARHVVRTRMYVTDITRVAEYGRAHQEFFGAYPPAATMVEIRALVAPDMLIEVEVEAYVPEGDG